MTAKEVLRMVYEDELMEGRKIDDDLWEEILEKDAWMQVSIKAMNQHTLTIAEKAVGEEREKWYGANRWADNILTRIKTLTETQ